MINNNSKIGFIGAGKMASAIMGGIISSGFSSSENIFVYDINPEALSVAKANFNVNTLSSIEELAKSVDVILIATKPFVIQDVLSNLSDYADNKLVISILAGTTIRTLEQKLAKSRVIRVMPNTPAFVKEGMCAICKGTLADASDVEFVDLLLSNIGKTVRVEEKFIDIVTSVSGSGPAFYYYIIDQIAKAGEKLGLDYKTALTLSAQTALGSAKMILEGKQTPEELIVAVTTPGGCTAVGNEVLNNSDIAQILDKTIEDTMLKAKALG